MGEYMYLICLDQYQIDPQFQSKQIEMIPPVLEDIITSLVMSAGVKVVNFLNNHISNHRSREIK